MESQSAFDRDRYQNIKRAAGFDIIRTYPSLFQHLGYRKRVAEELLHTTDETAIKLLEDVFENVNSKIKLILGL